MSAAAADPARRRAGWLSLLEELFDPASIERLERVGVTAGWQALEVGAGGGSIAAWLARRVQPHGRVVATDVDTDLLDGRIEQGLEVLRHDVLVDDLPLGSFDLVHCRALLVHLPDPDRALARMVSWLRPGGVLLAEEPWIDAAMLSPDPMTARAVRALKELMDGSFGRRLPIALGEVGLERVDGEAQLAFFKGGTKLASFYRQPLAGASEWLVASGEVKRDEVERMTARFDDPGCCDCGWPRIAAWGWKPS